MGRAGAVGAGGPPFFRGEGPGTVRCRSVCAERVWWGAPEREPSRCHYSLCDGDRRAAGDTSRLGDTGRPGLGPTRAPLAAPQLCVRCSGPRASPRRGQKGLCLRPCSFLGAPGGRADVPCPGCDTILRPHPGDSLTVPLSPLSFRVAASGRPLGAGALPRAAGLGGLLLEGPEPPACSGRVQAGEAPALGGRRKVKRMRARAEIPAAGPVRCGGMRCGVPSPICSWGVSPRCGRGLWDGAGGAPWAPQPGGLGVTSSSGWAWRCQGGKQKMIKSQNIPSWKGLSMQEQVLLPPSSLSLPPAPSCCALVTSHKLRWDQGWVRGRALRKLKPRRATCGCAGGWGGCQPRAVRMQGLGFGAARRDRAPPNHLGAAGTGLSILLPSPPRAPGQLKKNP